MPFTPDLLRNGGVPLTRHGEVLGLLKRRGSEYRVHFQPEAAQRGLTLFDVWSALDQACTHVVRDGEEADGGPFFGCSGQA